MICGYSDCNQEITDQRYTFKYFPEDKKHKPVHDYHLSTRRKEQSHVKDEPQKITPVTDIEADISEMESQS